MLKLLRIFLVSLQLIVSLNLISGDNLRVDADYCVYKYNESSLIELYYCFYTSDLTLHKLENESFEIAGLLDVTIKDNDSKTIVEKSYRIPFEIRDTSAFAKEQKLLGQLNIILKPSTYKLMLKAKDYYDTSKFSIIEQNIEVSGFDTDSLRSSSLQICSDIEKSNDLNSVFYKNGLEVTPNPSKLFGNNMPSLFYYIEFYNLKKISTNFYKVSFQISKDDQIVNNFTNSYTVKGNTKGEFGKIDISKLNTGKYKLLLSIKDSLNFLNYETNNYFWVYNSNIDTSGISDEYGLSEYPNMSEKLVNDEIDKIK
ncbi:MAG TPA: hypothetical protein VGK25_05630, partial [Ignavibacteria bacterium]